MGGWSHFKKKTLRACEQDRTDIAAARKKWKGRQLWLDGTTACMTFAGAANTEVSGTYVSNILVPTLRKSDPVVMDNLSKHKIALTVSLIESARAKAVFLPTYSPDLNPVEMM